MVENTPCAGVQKPFGLRADTGGFVYSLFTSREFAWAVGMMTMSFRQT